MNYIKYIIAIFLGFLLGRWYDELLWKRMGKKLAKKTGPCHICGKEVSYRPEDTIYGDLDLSIYDGMVLCDEHRPNCNIPLIREADPELEALLDWEERYQLAQASYQYFYDHRNYSRATITVNTEEGLRENCLVANFVNEVHGQLDVLIPVQSDRDWEDEVLWDHDEEAYFFVHKTTMDKIVID